MCGTVHIGFMCKFKPELCVWTHLALPCALSALVWLPLSTLKGLESRLVEEHVAEMCPLATVNVIFLSLAEMHFPQWI